MTKSFLSPILRKTPGGAEAATETDEHLNQKPWLSKIEQIGPFSIWLVDGPFIRTHLEQEFTNFAQPLHPDFRKIIPPNEFWIEQGTDSSEHKFFVENMLTQHRMMSRGRSYGAAEREGIRAEQRERGRHEPNLRKSGTTLKGLPSPEISLRKRIGNLEIWIVDGRKARAIDPRFCVGGHDLVYEYVPENHIWLDSTTPRRDWPFNEVHELGERRDMEIGYSYELAHFKWSRIENACRHEPNEMLRQQKLLGILDEKTRRGVTGKYVISEAL